MDAYTAFAQVYDLFMDNVPYKEWSLYICRVLREYGITDGPVLDLGCGTGKLTRYMALEGYDMTGVDSSVDMLAAARAESAKDGIFYLHQEMQQLELDGCVRAVYSACDCLNYLLQDGELEETFLRVYRYLENGGIFLFDMNTDYKYRVMLGDGTFAESRKEGAFIWENFYDEKTAVNEYDLTLFVPEENGLFRRYTETHFQRNYSLEDVQKMAGKAGFACRGIYDDYTKEAVCEKSERATFVFQK